MKKYGAFLFAGLIGLLLYLTLTKTKTPAQDSLVGKQISLETLGQPIYEAPESHELPLEAEDSSKIPSATPPYKALVFMASWCGHCKLNLPMLEKLSIPVWFIQYRETAPPSEAYQRVAQKIFADDKGSLSKTWNIKGVPEFFLLDATNTIVLHKRGKLTPDYIKETLAPLLKQSSEA